MILGIDIDDVVTESSRLFTQYAHKYEHQFCNNHEITNNLKDLMRGKLTKPMLALVKTYSSEVWLKLELKPNVVEVLERFKTKGFKLIFVTSRNNEMNPETENITNEYFNKQQIPYDKIIYGTHDKRQSCLAEGVNVFIDDSIDSCNEMLASTNIITYLFNSEINQDFACNAQRVNDWLELEKLITQNIEK